MQLRSIMKSKRGQVFQQLTQLAIGVTVLALVLVVAFLIMSQTKSNNKVSADPNATAALTSLQNALDNVPSWSSIIVITVIGAVLIGLVTAFARGTQ